MENGWKDSIFVCVMEEKSYELSNHLGNVHMTLSDYRRKEADGLGVAYYSQIKSASDYYPFGMLLTDGNYSSGSYRYGFNSQEKDDEIYGEGNSYSAKFWQYDARLGRRWNLDPKPNPSISRYATFANNPVCFNDPFGDTIKINYKTGFLGLGGEKELKYEEGKLYNSDGSEYNGDDAFAYQSKEALNEIRKSKEGGTMIKELEASKNNFIIESGSSSKFVEDNKRKAYSNQLKVDPRYDGSYSLSGGSGGTITWDPSGTNLPLTDGKTGYNANMDLAHEMAHASDANWGLLDDREYKGVERDEWRAVHRENVIRSQLGLPLRSHYVSLRPQAC